MEPVKNAKNDKKVVCKNKDIKSQKRNKEYYVLDLGLGWGVEHYSISIYQSYIGNLVEIYASVGSTYLVDSAARKILDTHKEAMHLLKTY